MYSNIANYLSSAVVPLDVDGLGEDGMGFEEFVSFGSS